MTYWVEDSRVVAQVPATDDDVRILHAALRERFLTVLAFGAGGSAAIWLFVGWPVPAEAVVPLAILGLDGASGVLPPVFAVLGDFRSRQVDLYRADAVAVIVDEHAREGGEAMDDEDHDERVSSPPGTETRRWPSLTDPARLADPTGAPELTAEERAEIRYATRLFPRSVFGGIVRAGALVALLATGFPNSTTASALAFAGGLGWFVLVPIVLAGRMERTRKRRRAVRDPRLTRVGLSILTSDGIVWSHLGVPAAWRRGSVDTPESVMPQPHGDGI